MGRSASLKGSLRDALMGRWAARGYRILGCWFSEPSLFEQCIHALGFFFCFIEIVAVSHRVQTVISKSLMLVEFLFAVLLCLPYLHVHVLECRKLHAVCENGLNAYRNPRKALVSAVISFILFN
jgi:hypothetical protein